MLSAWSSSQSAPSDSHDDANETVKLSSTVDARSIIVKKRDVAISDLLRTALQVDPSAKELFLSVNGSSLAFISAFIAHHGGNEPKCPPVPLASSVMSDVCEDRWDAVFIDTVATEGNVYDVCLAANYMGITSLIHLAAAKIASGIRTRPVNHIRAALTPTDTHRALYPILGVLLATLLLGSV